MPERPRKKPERSGQRSDRPKPAERGKATGRPKPADRGKSTDRAKPAARRTSSDRGRTTDRTPSSRKPTPRKSTEPTSGADRWSRGQRGTPADRPRRPAADSRSRPEPTKQAPKKWGGVARRGAGSLSEDQATASRIWRDAVKRARDEGPVTKRSGDEWTPEVWTEDAEPTGRQPAPRVQRVRRPKSIDADAASELTAERGEKRGSRLQARLSDAAGAFERGRYQDAARILRPLAEEAPGAASVRELLGVSLYHLERWRSAARELEAFRSLTGSVEQHPVLADSYRALKRYKKVDELWEELRQASPGAELVAEGRIVAAGALADRGDLQGAIALLEKAKYDLKRPREHHLRLVYALADLYERVGDLPRARELFGRIAERDRSFYDAATRARALR
jgi:hypothetical protein